MGNRIGGQKQKDQKNKEDTRREKEAKKEREKLQKKEKKDRKKKPHPSGLDTDFDESSHVTGGDSESCVFHSAENVSTSPYLDACTRSELEHGTFWSGMCESFSSATQHPKVLSSKDFKDGFSLEACIPPDIARPENYDDGASSSNSRFEGRSGSSVKSRRSNNSVKSNSAQPRSRHDTPISYRSHQGDDAASVGTSSLVSGGGGYHTPLLSTPIFGRMERPNSPTAGASSTLTRVQETDPNDSMDITPSTSFHHPHFYNHQKPIAQKQQQQKQQPTSSTDFRNLPKPTSPHPQRRALSPKMTSSPVKLISSDDSSSSPTTPTPQRRAANLLDLFRPGSRSEKSKKNKSRDKQAPAGAALKEGKVDTGGAEGEGKSKSGPLWKTWERSSAKKIEKQNRVSIFGTTRKTEQKKTGTSVKRVEETKTVETIPTCVNDTKATASSENTSTTGKPVVTTTHLVTHKTSRTSSRSSDSNLESSSRVITGSDESDLRKRTSSPPMVKSAAFCIMKLEELERSIEQTIREKFPDAEPFLLKKRTKDDEVKGSRSLPSTPSLKKKLYVVRDVDDPKQNSQKDPGDVSTRMTFECLPSPAMSPVVLRRFGARTRHASISPKIPRAKTAALYASPGEMSRMEESVSTKTVTKVPVYHALSTKQPQTPAMPTQFMKPLSSSQKSTSKYDNVMDDNDDAPAFLQTGSQLVRQYGVEEYDSDEVDEKMSYVNVRDSSSNPVIVPTFSAVFGSVSPKLRRHLQMKLEETSRTAEANERAQISKPGINLEKKKKANAKELTQPTKLTKEIPKDPKIVKVVGSAVPISVSLTVRSTSSDGHSDKVKNLPVKQKSLSEKFPISGVAMGGGVSLKCSTETATSCISPAQPATVNKSVTSTPAAISGSVKQRTACLNKSLSEGWAAVSAQENTGSNAGRGVRTQLDATKSLKNAAAQTVSSLTDERKKLPRVECNPSEQQQQHHNAGSRVDETEKCCGPTSPGTQRKHSTDHVIFGSAVALPCRFYASAPLSPPVSPGQEELNNVNISKSASARDGLPGQNTSVLYVKKQKSVSREEDNRAEFEPRGTSVAAPTAHHGDSVSVKNNVVSSVPISNTFSGSGNSTKHQGGADINKWQIWPTATTYQRDQLVNDVTSHSSLKQVQTYRDIENTSADPRTDYPTGDKTPVLDDVTLPLKNRPENNRSRDEVPDGGIRKDYHPNYREDEQRFVVLRNPVSKVISEMINVSKLEEQIERKQQLLQQEQKQQLQQQSRIPQAGPEYGVKHVQQVVAVVRTPTYELPCLTLEEKTVRSDSSVSLPSSPINSNNEPVDRDSEGSNKDVKSESKCQEIQTDAVTTADKGVDSNSLTRNAASKTATGPPLPLVRNAIDKRSTGQVWPDVTKFNMGDSSDDSSGESEFLQMVLASKKTVTTTQQIDPSGEPKVDDETEKQAPPPPSPTAIQQLIEEFEEEGSDAEEHEKKEIEMAMRKESEIKEFTDKIYKRLSNLLGSQEDIEDDVFEEDAERGPKKHDVEDLFSRLDRGHDSFSSDSDEEPGYNTAPMMSSGERNLSKVLTIETSSSLTTTTSSDSDIYEEPPPFQTQGSETNANFLSSEGFPKRKTEPNVFIFPELENVRGIDSDDARKRRNSREYHSDDDVATGRGIPEYYDDKPLWTRRQKPPGHMSAAMMAIRRRERRERWLKKRRRNKTDLLSTGSSDTGSELALDRRESSNRITELSSFGYDEDEEFAEYERSIQRNEMGSGILTSPKYSKPILPFLGGSAPAKNEDELEKKSVAQKIETERSFYRDAGNQPSSSFDSHRQRTHAKERRKKSSYDNKLDNEEEDFEISDQGDLDNVLNADPNGNDKTDNPERLSSDSNLAIPGIEETFNELMSVKHILEGLQDRTPTNETNTEVKFMPLTTENVKSIREYYKDCYSSGNGRRSRMSATDRTESDLDIYSENRDDDESTDSNFNADDEEDDDGMEPYATADDDLAATGGSSSTGPSGRRGPGDDDDSETNVVVSCTFYNSNAFPAIAESKVVPKSAPIAVAKSSVKSTPNTLTPTAQASLLNSDEEFWAGSAAIDDSYRQLETAADAVSSTFQNAREQMQDIQHHLQALRRQMEGLQDDLTSTPKTVPQEVSLENQGK